MSQKTPLHHAPEDFCCSICSGYLSCSPVRVLFNGNSLCGRCSSPDDIPIYRNLALEAILRKMSFPCRFKQFGCTEMVLFDQAGEHESKCVHRTFSCHLSVAGCSWQGSLPQLHNHFKESHVGLLKDDGKINLKLSEDSQGVIMVIQAFLPFIIEYIFKAEEKVLKYVVRLCVVGNGYEASCKIELANSENLECKVVLKYNNCALYDESFFDVDKLNILNLNKFLQSLENPTHVQVAMKPKVVKLNSTKSEEAVLPSLTCGKCQNYLVAPLFDVDDLVVCCDCAKKDSKCTPSTKVHILNLVMEAVYPCRWRRCDFTGKQDVFKSHQTTCPFRIYDCIFSGCEDTFDLDTAVDHFKTKHNIDCLIGPIVYKTSFKETGNKTKSIFTIRQGIPVLVQHRMESGEPLVHHLGVYTSLSDSRSFKGSLYFEHEHCKIKSKQFVTGKPSSNVCDITLNQLPPCFKDNDKLSVTVSLNVKQ